MLMEDGYLLLPGFITPEQAEHLNQEFMFALATTPHAFDFDGQCNLSKAIKDFIPFVELLVGKCNELSGIFGQNLLPTYAYARFYVNGEVLERHSDRPACEVSITLNLAGDKEWPIWFETPAGEARSLILNPGDAAMYLGCERPHWREAFTGNHSTQVFLHYVRSRGFFNNHFFDSDNKRRGGV
jgi:hypothetical protein